MHTDTLQMLLNKHNIDYYVVPSVDEFQGEYVPPHNARLEFITGFTGSNGIAILAKTGQSYFLTDGRYLLQASNQLDKNFIIKDLAKQSLDQLIVELIKSGKKIGLDPKLHTVAQISALTSHREATQWPRRSINTGISKSPKVLMDCHELANASSRNDGNGDEKLSFIEQNLIDLIWKNRPQKTKSKIFVHDLKYAGKPTSFKKKIIIDFLKDKQAEAVVLTDPHSICWLLNIRGNDLEFTPIVLCHAIVYATGLVKLFLYDQASTQLQSYFAENNVETFTLDEFSKELKALNNKTCINNKTPHWIARQVRSTVVHEDPCELPKACKNDVELKGAVHAHIKDGEAVTQFLSWLKANIGKEKMTEISLAEKLLQFRRKQEGFVCPSFASIVGFKENGAIIHYHATPETSKTITGDGILLIDSGGQYFEGTTDITRTIAIGTPTPDQVHDFTLVLKGHIRIASAVFAERTTGAELDKLARADLEAEGKNYAHGTGHGVGSFLSVHEGPQSISQRSTVPLLPGMIVSIEPGFYKEGEYGIRIESLAYVKKSNKAGYLEFELLTKVPIDNSLIDFSLLTTEEKAWLESD